MPRDYEVYLADIIAAIDRIGRHLRRANGDFALDELILDAVVRNLEVIGEAAKGVPEAVRRTRPGVPWRAIAGLRDILIHEYFGVDAEIIRDIVQTKLPVLRAQIRSMRRLSSAGRGLRARKRRLGLLTGKLQVPPDFDGPPKGAARRARK